MKSVFKLTLFIFIFFFTGCISWNEGWKTKYQPTGQGDVKALLATASSFAETADTADKVKNVIAAYEKVIAVDPENYDALSRLGEFNHLYAYIYATEKDVKKEYYIKALQYCERAMYTNPEFRELIDKGESRQESFSTLTAREMHAVFYWYVAAGQYWTECLNPLSKLLNFNFARKGTNVLKKMNAIDPDWSFGLVHMAWGARHAILPGFMSGDVKKAADEFSRAINLGPDVIAHYYVRAKYLYVKTGNKEGFKKDLEYVIAADISKDKFNYAWSAGYKMKAKELLGQIDELF